MTVTMTVEQIARALGLDLWGEGALPVTGAAEPAAARADQIALAMTPAYAAQLAQGRARAALLRHDADPAALGLRAAILAPRPRHALAGLSALFDPGPAIAPGVHPLAHVDPAAQIGDGAAIGPFVAIGPGARIGAGARIAPGAVIGAGAVLGAGALVLERVVIGAGVRIGARLIAQPGAVIGGDGFSFVTPEPGAIEAVRSTLGDRQGRAQGAYARIHSLGGVAIGDDVEIGANACIDRGTVADTTIGSGTKIDNLVQIGHNVRIGRDCLLCGQAGVAGSTVLGDRVVLGGQAGVTDHLTIGQDVIVAAGTLLRTNQPAGRVLLGDPAMPMAQGIETWKALRRLPRLAREVAGLRKALSLRDNGD